MYDTILEYIVNADLYYRLWMVAELQNPHIKNYQTPNKQPIAQTRREWFPDLVNQFEDVRLVPAGILIADGNHAMDSDMRFHTGSKKPTINISKMEIFWGDENMRSDAVRKVGPARVTLNGLKMWHHQDALNRRRGDAIICEQATFKWNTKEASRGAFRESGPFQVVVRNFRAAYNMGTATDATFDNFNVSWGTENGIRLGENRVEEVIEKNKIKVNYLLTDSVFGDDGEEFIFWDEIGRAQEMFL